MKTCKLCGGPIKEGEMFAAVVVAVEGQQIKARFDFCMDCILKKIGTAVEKAGIKILPELIAKFLGG